MVGAEVMGRGWREQAENLSLSHAFGPRVCWRESWWLGHSLGSVVTHSLQKGVSLPGRR